MRWVLLWAVLMAAPPPKVLPLDAGLGVAPHEVDRSTPLASVQGFLEAAHQGRYPVAAFYLNLNDLPVERQPAEGPKRARRLRFVLDRALNLDLRTVAREPEGDANRPGLEELGVIPLERTMVPIRLARIHTEDGDVWVFTRDTVRAINRLYEAFGPPLGEVLPEVFFARPLKGLEIWQWIGVLLVLALATLVALVVQRVVLAVGHRMAKVTRGTWEEQLVLAARGPLWLALWAAVVWGGSHELLLPPDIEGGFRFLWRSLIIVAFAWFLLRFLELLSAVVENQVVGRRMDPGNRAAVRTQMAVLRRVASFAVYMVTAAILLMQFAVVRTVGVSLLASAGVAGLVVGLAAQKSIGTLLAGIQLSITQPIRIGDSVVVEGESGTIEEINLTYVVVRIWDLRRLVIPMTYFLDKPFQNWSKGPSDLMGTVILQVDYTADVEVLRQELGRLLAGEGKRYWDGREGSIAVTDASERTQTLRVLVSSPGADSNWKLRCLIREKLIAFLRQYPGWLPSERTRPHDAPP